MRTATVMSLVALAASAYADAEASTPRRLHRNEGFGGFSVQWDSSNAALWICLILFVEAMVWIATSWFIKGATTDEVFDASLAAPKTFVDSYIRHLPFSGGLCAKNNGRTAKLAISEHLAVFYVAGMLSAFYMMVIRNARDAYETLGPDYKTQFRVNGTGVGVAIITFIISFLLVKVLSISILPSQVVNEKTVRVWWVHDFNNRKGFSHFVTRTLVFLSSICLFVSSVGLGASMDHPADFASVADLNCIIVFLLIICAFIQPAILALFRNSNAFDFAAEEPNASNQLKNDNDSPNIVGVSQI